jgi:hypothetical protein
MPLGHRSFSCDLDDLQPEPAQQHLQRLPQGANGIDARLRTKADHEGRARGHVAKLVPLRCNLAKQFLRTFARFSLAGVMRQQLQLFIVHWTFEER